jgi:hypothetical protein
LSQQFLNLTPQNSGLGDNPFTGGTKINANFTELYSGVVTANQVATGNFFAPTAAIDRLNDRVFIGGATVNDGKFPPVSIDWLSTYQDAAGYTNFTMYGELSVLTGTNVNSNVAITAGAQAANANSNAQSVIALEAFAISNNLTFNNQAWAVYAEAHKRSPTANVYGIETDIHTNYLGTSSNPFVQADTVGVATGDGAGVGGATFTLSVSGTTLTVGSSIYPLFQQVSFQIGIGNNVFGVGIPLGTTIIGLGTGTGGLGTYTLSANLGTITARWGSATNENLASAAYVAWNNIVQWRKGFLFGALSINGCDGVNGSAAAISMAKGHLLEWWNNTPAVVSTLGSTVATPSNGTKLTFTDSGLQVANLTGESLAFFPAITSAANWLVFDGATTTNAPTVAAAGGDTNVSLGLTAKGTGVLFCNSPLEATNGLIRTYRTIAAATYSLQGNDTHLQINFAGTVTLTLPTPTVNGRELSIRTVTNNTVVSATANVIPLVGGAATTAILAATAGKWCTLLWDGTNWDIQASN